MIEEKCGKTILSCHVDVCGPACLTLNKVRVGMILLPVKRLLFADLEFLVTRVSTIVILKQVHGIWTVTVVDVKKSEVYIHIVKAEQAAALKITNLSLAVPSTNLIKWIYWLQKSRSPQGITRVTENPSCLPLPNSPLDICSLNMVL